jgi:hypothetical protein
MFSKLTVLFAAALAVSATDSSNCSTGTLQCCPYLLLQKFYMCTPLTKDTTLGNSVGSAGTLLPGIFGLLGIDALTQIGLTCTAISVINGITQTWYVT